jgi:hypothetical protein
MKSFFIGPPVALGTTSNRVSYRATNGGRSEELPQAFIIPIKSSFNTARKILLQQYYNAKLCLIRHDGQPFVEPPVQSYCGRHSAAPLDYV